jgi:hypothetical protein
MASSKLAIAALTANRPSAMLPRRTAPKIINGKVRAIRIPNQSGIENLA